MLQPSAVVELIWQDASGSTAALTVFALSSFTVAEIDASASALASLVAPLTDCVLVGQRIRYKTAHEEHAMPDFSTPVTRAGVLFFSTDGVEVGGLVNVPAIADDYLIDVGPGADAVIDIEDVDIVALVDAMMELPCCNPFGDEFTALLSGYVQSRL